MSTRRTVFLRFGVHVFRDVVDRRLYLEVGTWEHRVTVPLSWKVER